MDHCMHWKISVTEDIPIFNAAALIYCHSYMETFLYKAVQESS